MKPARLIAGTMPLPDWLRADSGRTAIPSWAGSVLAHAVLAALVVFLAQLPSCRREPIGDGAGQVFREVGIRLKPDEATAGGNGPVLEQQTAVATPAVALAAATPQPVTAPPVSLDLPELSRTPALIGPGAMPGVTPPLEAGLVRPGRASTAGSGGTGGGAGGFGSGGSGGGTTFLGIESVGKRFVYVIDRSFSMAADNVFLAALIELQASLSQLNETQQFQVIFYNNEFVPLETRGGRFDMFRGTAAQRLKALEQMRGIEPSGGTRHLPALLEALKYNPEVIYLLTDGATESALDRKDLDDIKRHNRNGACIHCIEFGRGVKSPLGDAGNFLKTLARENTGKYAYRNVAAGLTVSAPSP